MKQWQNRLLTLIGVLLILVAFFIFLKPYADNYFSKQEEETKIENYNEQSKNNGKTEIPKDKSKMVGYISVPDADIKAPVYPGAATPKQLDRGISLATENESLEDQNISIAGHTNTNQNDYQFTNLPEAKKGSKVYFNVGEEKRKYRITKIFDVKPDDVDVLDEQNKSKDQLTLITCDNYNEETGQWEDRTIYVAEEM